LNKFKLKNNVIFTGELSASEIKKQLLNCNVFISSSSIENSSNAIVEALLLGVPVIASGVGGTFDILMSEPNTLYHYNLDYVLAYKIIDVFNNKENNLKNNQDYYRNKYDPYNLSKIFIDTCISVLKDKNLY
jgi:glycosyltransferase involved in cell wall biosynthesis